MSESRTGGLDLEGLEARAQAVHEVLANIVCGEGQQPCSAVVGWICRNHRAVIAAEAALSVAPTPQDVVALVEECRALRTALRPPAQGEVNRLALAIIGLLGEKELLGRAPTEQETWKMLDGLLKVGVRLVGAPERDLNK